MSYSDEVLADSPAAYYRMGEASGATMVDSSGNGRDGTYTNVTYGATGALVGDSDTAITFGSGTSEGEVAYGSWMNSLTITIEFWVKTTTTAVRVPLQRDVTGNRVWQIQTTSSPGRIGFITIAGGNPSIASLTAINDGNWHHVVFAIQTGGGAADYRVYIDGVLDNSSTPVSTSLNQPTATQIEIGGRAGTNFPGSIDEVAIYPGVQLSAARVLAHYEAATTVSSEDLDIAATMPQPTLAVSLSAESVADLTVSATMPQPVLAIDLDAPEILTVAAVMPQPTLAVTLDSVSGFNLNVAATMPQPVLAVDLLAESVADLTVAATMPQPVLDVALVTGDEVEVSATMPQPTLAVVLDVEVIAETDTSNLDDGIFLGDGLAEIVWEPDIVAPPTTVAASLAEVRTVAQVIDTAPGVLPAYTPAVGRSESTPAVRERVLIGDVDFTYYRDVPIQIGPVRFLDPLLYGTTELTLPQINPQFPDTLGPLATYFKGKRVTIQLVLDGDPATIVDADYYKGFVSRVDTNGHELVLTVGGQAAGRLSAIEVRPPVYRRKQDVEHILVDMLRDARVKAKKHDGLSGVGLIRRGGSDGLSIFNETLAVWAGATDSPITFTPNADGYYRKTAKDLTTIHATAYLDSSLISQSLSQDFMEQPNRVYAQGWTAAGELVTNIKNPGQTQGDPSDFPLASGTLQVGMDDADTTSGAGVTTVQQLLAIHNFYDVNDGTPGEYDLALAGSVEAFQEFAGLNETGEVGQNTWDRLWALDQIGYSLDDAREYPMWEDPATRKWDRAANGAKVAANPLYDPHVQPVDLSIDVGGPFGRGEIRKFAKSKGAPEGGVWVGQLTLRSGLVAGEHNPSDPFTSADVLDRRELMPNMNVWLPTFDGGTLVHVTGVDHGPEESTALVSTHPATTVETWAAIERLREAKSNPGRQWSGHVRKSQVRNDLGPQWDTSNGWLAQDQALVAGWNRIWVPAGQSGILHRVRVQLETPAEFAMFLAEKDVSIDALNSRPRISEPLTAPSGRPWYEQEAIVTWLESRNYLVAWGTHKQPCGYDPSRKNDDEGATGSAVTGLFVEQVGTDYSTDPSINALALLVWVAAPNAVLSGRILRNQRTTDF